LVIMALLQLENITRAFESGGELAGAFNVSLALDSGVMAVLAGPSGSGKTTLLQVAGLLDQPDEGRVLLNGQSVSHLAESARCDIRLKQLGFIFQNFNLMPVLDAIENVMLPIQLLGHSRADASEMAASALVRVGLGNRLGHLPGELSGGQQQRVAIARALVAGPILVFADEPTANLDKAHGAPLIDLMRELASETGTSFLAASHDPMVIDRADEVYRLEDGRIVAIERRDAAC
jgi:putative ABC transport system ATP-binding protein